MNNEQDGRAELARFLEGKGWVGAATITEVILERFDVTPKSVVSESKLGFMVKQAYQDPAWNMDYVGSRMLDQLEAAGLRIVRRDEGQR